MPLIYPTFDELAAQIEAEFRVQIPSIDPTVFGSWAMAFAHGNAALAQSISYLVRDLEKQLFPQTATDDFLDIWGNYENLTRQVAVLSSGSITVTGTAGTTVPTGTDFTGENGVPYKSTEVGTITATSQAVTIVMQSAPSTLAVVFCPSDHYLATNTEVTISGATPIAYNGTFPIVVIGSALFTYDVGSIPAAESGSPQWDADRIPIPVEAQTSGPQGNAGGGTKLTLDIPTVGIDDDAYVGWYELFGGTIRETDDAYRARILLSRSIQEGVFTPDQIKLAVFSIPGNTRVWVKKPIPRLTGSNVISNLTSVSTTATAVCTLDHNLLSGMSVTISGASPSAYNGTYVVTVTDTDTYTYTFAGGTSPATGSPVWTGEGSYLSPEAGQVSVYFLRDNDTPITPDPGQVHLADLTIQGNGAMPANMVSDDLFVQSPVLGPGGTPTPFIFTALSPDTSTMRTAVEDNLKAFFEDSVNFEENVTLASISGAIQNTQDLETGDWISTFTLSIPAIDIPIGAGEIGSLGVIQWSI